MKVKYPHIPSLTEELQANEYNLVRILYRINSFPRRYVAEKVDGINIQMCMEEGRVVVRSRGGRDLSRKKGEEYKWLHKFIKENYETLHRFLEVNLSRSLFWEYVPPKKPDYLTYTYREAPFIAFLDMVERGKGFIPYEESENLVSNLFNIPRIKRIPHQPLPKLTEEYFFELVRSIDSRKSDFGCPTIEGLVIKCYNPENYEFFFMKIKKEDVEFIKRKFPNFSRFAISII